ncbi:phosphoheptose isomerase [Pelagibacterales bacterium SAG-MED02]|nr:phosphoheptose isomerase [Pelagibacterales bacterium SAG-MED02]
MKKKIFCFDLDNVICKTNKSEYKKSIPITKVIDLINLLYDQNYYIKIFTSRYMGRNNDNFNLVKKKYYNETKRYLKKWGVKHHELIMGKPSYDVFVDDKNFLFIKNWVNAFKKKYLK